MPEQTQADTPGQQPAGGPSEATAPTVPEVGTPEPADGTGTQGVEGGGTAAPPKGETPAQQPPEVGQQPPKGDTPERAAQRLAYLQPRADLVNRIQAEHPDLFDAQGNYVGAQAPTQQPPEVGQQPGQQQWQPFPYQPPDPQAEAWDSAGRRLQEGLYSDQPLLALRDAMTALGFNPQQQPAQGLDPDRARALAREEFGTLMAQEAAFDRQVEAVEAEITQFGRTADPRDTNMGARFLQQGVTVNGVPSTLEEALPQMCAAARQQGLSDRPIDVLRRHPHFGAQMEGAYRASIRAEELAKMRKEGLGQQLPDGGIGMGSSPMGVGIEEIDGGTEPLAVDTPYKG